MVEFNLYDLHGTSEGKNSCNLCMSEFGVIYGYGDENKVFFSKGIGSRNVNASMPVLYNNPGKTFEWAPVLYCEMPEAAHEADWNQAYVEALRLYTGDESTL